MKRSHAIAGAAAAGVLVLTAGVGLASPDPTAPRGPGMYVAEMDRVHRMTVRSEADYLAQMVPHHEEAVTAAQQLARSDRPELRRLGADIVRTQTAEIATMQRWLQQWYPRQADASYEPMMRDLTGLSGDELDRTFLEDMVVHHMSAVMMSQQLLARGLVEHAEVGAFARQVADTQHDEIVQMQQWLGTWFGAAAGRGGAPGRGHWPAGQ